MNTCIPLSWHNNKAKSNCYPACHWTVYYTTREKVFAVSAPVHITLPRDLFFATPGAAKAFCEGVEFALGLKNDT